MDFTIFLNPFLWVKIITLTVIGLYAVFTFVVFNQVRVMTQILSLSHAEAILKIVSVIHVVLAVFLFFLGFVIL